MSIKVDSPVARIVEELEADVLFGRALPRERLVEDDLIQRFGVSRHGIRAALIDLERRGIVVRIPNKGAVVRSFSRPEVDQIGAVRDLLNGHAAALIPLPALPGQIELLERLQRRHADEVASGDALRIHLANQAFHLEFFSLCGNEFLAQTITEYAQLSLVFRCHGITRPVYAARARDEHWAMIDALRQADRPRLVDLCVAHTHASRDLYCSMQGWRQAP